MRFPQIQGVSLPGSAPTASILFMWRLLAALVVAVILAKWTWVFFAPHSETVMPAVQLDAHFETEHLFGIAAGSSVTAQAALSNVRLVGVFAGTPGFAVLELDGKHQLGVATGQEVAADTKLVEVAFDHVVIERGGVRQRIVLEDKAGAIKSATSSQVQTIPLPIIEPAVASILPASAVPGPAAKLYMPPGRARY